MPGPLRLVPDLDKPPMVDDPVYHGGRNGLATLMWIVPGRIGPSLIVFPGGYFDEIARKDGGNNRAPGHRRDIWSIVADDISRSRQPEDPTPAATL